MESEGVWSWTINDLALISVWFLPSDHVNVLISLLTAVKRSILSCSERVWMDTCKKKTMASCFTMVENKMLLNNNDTSLHTVRLFEAIKTQINHFYVNKANPFILVWSSIFHLVIIQLHCRKKAISVQCRNKRVTVCLVERYWDCMYLLILF